MQNREWQPLVNEFRGIDEGLQEHVFHANIIANDLEREGSTDKDAIKATDMPFKLPDEGDKAA